MTRFAPFIALAILGVLAWVGLVMVAGRDVAALWTILVSGVGLLAIRFAGTEEPSMTITARSVSEICEVVEHFVPHATTWVHSYGSLTTVEVGGVFFAFIPAYRRRIERRITDALRARGGAGVEWKVVVR